MEASLRKEAEGIPAVGSNAEARRQPCLQSLCSNACSHACRALLSQAVCCMREWESAAEGAAGVPAIDSANQRFHQSLQSCMQSTS